MLSFLSSPPGFVKRILDNEANKLYDNRHQLYAAAPFIDSEVNHKRYFIKIPFINRGIDFIDLPSIFEDRSVTSPLRTISKIRSHLLYVIDITNPLETLYLI